MFSVKGISYLFGLLKLIIGKSFNTWSFTTIFPKLIKISLLLVLSSDVLLFFSLISVSSFLILVSLFVVLILILLLLLSLFGLKLF